MFENHPSGASTSQVCHYLQEQQSDCFCQYDYGVAKNLRLYGQPTPPDYPLEKITSEVHLWYSDNDDMAAIVDVERLAELLPNKEMHHMEDPNWTHRDFAVHLEIRKYVNDPIIAIMDKYEQNM